MKGCWYRALRSGGHSKQQRNHVNSRSGEVPSESCSWCPWLLLTRRTDCNLYPPPASETRLYSAVGDNNCSAHSYFHLSINPPRPVRGIPVSPLRRLKPRDSVFVAPEAADAHDQPLRKFRTRYLAPFPGTILSDVTLSHTTA